MPNATIKVCGEEHFVFPENSFLKDSVAGSNLSGSYVPIHTNIRVGVFICIHVVYTWKQRERQV